MKNEILTKLHDPHQLELLYRSNKGAFKTAFNALFPEIEGESVAQIWYERLNFQRKEISWGSRREILFVVLASIFAAVLVKIPEFIPVEPLFFYPRNISFVVFPILIAYFLFIRSAPISKVLGSAFLIAVSVVYINLLPGLKVENSDTLLLACIHLPLVLWFMWGMAFIGPDYHDYRKRIAFLRFNGDLVVVIVLALMAGGLLTGITIALFQQIELPIQEFYFQYVIVCGAAALPIVSAFLVRTNPQLVSKVTSMIAKICTPFLLVTLVLFLFTLLLKGHGTFQDRNFLLVFNFLLVGVMAIVLFSVTSMSPDGKNKISLILLSALSFVTIIINLIALVAIIGRIVEGGFTPNRLAVFGSNLLVFIHLILVTYQLFRAIQKRATIVTAEKTIARFLPVYGLWCFFVTFLFPLIFQFQ